MGSLKMTFKEVVATTLVVFIYVNNVWGHGAMYYPSPWHATSECTPDTMYPKQCKFELKDKSQKCVDGCNRGAGLTTWFTNFTVVPEATLEEDMYAKAPRSSDAGLHPWNSPGFAPTHGNGCGVNGGNPGGCDGEDNVFGRCCGGGIQGGGCGGYVGGKPALTHYKEGFFGSPHVTTWKRGVPADVYWTSHAHHRGGYAFRLCKVENGEVWKVTEECFNNGHLKFSGTTSWVYREPNNEDYNEDGWTPQDSVRTTTGTTPHGSEWTKINLPKTYKRLYWAFRDLVEVPESLEAGEYVLSFRWDCQQSPQVWNACANIHVE